MLFAKTLESNPPKLHLITYEGDDLAKTKADLLEKAGFVRKQDLLAVGDPAPGGSVVLASFAQVEWYVQALGFRNERYRRFLLRNDHFWPARFVFGLRKPSSPERESLLNEAILQIPYYVQKVNFLSRC